MLVKLKTWPIIQENKQQQHYEYQIMYYKPLINVKAAMYEHQLYLRQLFSSLYSSSKSQLQKTQYFTTQKVKSDLYYYNFQQSTPSFLQQSTTLSHYL